jgi:hypothetical protein
MKNAEFVGLLVLASRILHSAFTILHLAAGLAVPGTM